MEYKSFQFEVKEVDEETGIFEGYAATFSNKPDAYGDIIEPGAFAKSLKEGGKRIKILWNHMPTEPIGKPIELKEDEKGLWVKGKLSLGVQRAREVLSLMKDKVITELSIGYDTVKQLFDEDTKVRRLKEVRLWDVSPVTFAANPEAAIASVKAFETRLDDLETAIKSGRVLSAASITKVRAALEALQALLEAASEEDEEGKATVPLEAKPYPNEHACRLREPDEFQEGTFKRITRQSDGKTYSIIMGRLKGETTMTEQAYRYDKDTWSAGEARSHCKEHDGKFEAASEKALPGAEPPSDTPDELEAAKLDSVLARVKHFSVQQAEGRINELLKKLEGN